MTSREDASRLDHELLLALAALAIDCKLAYGTRNGPAFYKALRNTAAVALRQIRANELQGVVLRAESRKEAA
jgi:hypothetical protein